MQMTAVQPRPLDHCEIQDIIGMPVAAARKWLNQRGRVLVEMGDPRPVRVNRWPFVVRIKDGKVSEVP